jgi:hypothetical protein
MDPAKSPAKRPPITSMTNSVTISKRPFISYLPDSLRKIVINLPPQEPIDHVQWLPEQGVYLIN